MFFSWWIVTKSIFISKLFELCVNKLGVFEKITNLRTENAREAIQISFPSKLNWFLRRKFLKSNLFLITEPPIKLSNLPANETKSFLFQSWFAKSSPATNVKKCAVSGPDLMDITSSLFCPSAFKINFELLGFESGKYWRSVTASRLIK